MVVFGLVVGVVSPSFAAPVGKSFTTEITPDTATAGTGVSFTLTITNTSDSAPLGASRITVPDGFVVDAVEVEAGRNWSLVSTDPIMILAESSGARLSPGQSITVDIDAVTPLQNGDDAYEFEVESRQANNFNGQKNDLNGSGPVVTVTGSAVACERGNSCQTGHSEAGTSVEVTTTCAVDAVECTNLIVDLDTNCLNQACAGRAAVWIPPTENTGGTVQVVLKVPKSAFGKAGAGQVRFFVAQTGATEAFECGTNDAVIACSYKVKPSGNTYQITATVAQVDPRGFAS